MKVIFSRKGFDSSAGGCPSPIIDGRPLSLPIPTRQPSPTTFGQLPNGVGEIVTDLSGGKYGFATFCHLDPDIDRKARPRLPHWRGAFGQVGAAQGHLAKQCIGPGDLFLFWGLFRPAAHTDRWRLTGGKEHRIFGWLQVDDVLSVGSEPGPTLNEYPWLEDHPHLHPGWSASNTVYIARNRLRLGGEDLDIPGWGLMKTGMRLTALGSTQPSLWTVPDWLDPHVGGTGMTYHPADRWLGRGELRSAARGQEFVADVGERNDAIHWIRQLLGESQ